MDPTFTHLATKVAFFVTVGVWVIGERYLGCRDLWSGVRRRGSQDRGTIWWTVGAIIAAVGGAFGLTGVRRLDLPGTLVWVILGLTAAWTGLAVRAWAVRTLGRYFTTVVVVRDDYQLVATGPYRWLVHPSYTGLLLVLVGIGLALDNAGSLLVMLLVPIIGIRRRISVEESALRDRFGAAYDEFVRDRYRLIPGLW